MVEWIYLVIANGVNHLFLAIDAVHSIDDKEYIYEISDSTLDLVPNHQQEDMEIIRDLTIQVLCTNFFNT